MVVLDRLLLPSMRILIGILIVILLLLLGFTGYVYKVKSDKDIQIAQEKQKVLQDKRRKEDYEKREADLYNSPNLSGLRSILNQLYIDKRFFKSAGWIQEEVYCTINSCNLRYLRDKTRLFDYIVLKKGDEEYLPIYTEDEMVYDSVIYPIDLTANTKFEGKLSDLSTCNDFISKTYTFKTLIGKKSGTSIEIETPSDYFSVGGVFDWATNKDLKTGTITFKTTDLYLLELFRDNYKNDLIIIDTLALNKLAISTNIKYYCI